MMFNLIEDLAKVASAAVAVPAAVAADAMTLGGTLANQEKPFTTQVLNVLSGDMDTVPGTGPATHDSPHEER